MVELSHKPRVYTGGYKSPYEKYSTRHPGGLPQMMDDISRAATMEFGPKIGEIGFPPPSPSDPREKKPKADDPDYSQNSWHTRLSTLKGTCTMRFLMFGLISPCW